MLPYFPPCLLLSITGALDFHFSFRLGLNFLVSPSQYASLAQGPGKWIWYSSMGVPPSLFTLSLAADTTDWRVTRQGSAANFVATFRLFLYAFKWRNEKDKMSSQINWNENKRMPLKKEKNSLKSRIKFRIESFWRSKKWSLSVKTRQE